jgi:hypothetical protein
MRLHPVDEDLSPGNPGCPKDDGIRRKASAIE